MWSFPSGKPPELYKSLTGGAGVRRQQSSVRRIGNFGSFACGAGNPARSRLLGIVAK
jgi:hypothetical protein